jgi:hypothetical protein
MTGRSTCSAELSPQVRAFYTETLKGLGATEIPLLVGGAFALGRYTGVERYTKDFDLYLRPGDVARTLRALEGLGCRTEMAFAHWLAKAYHGDLFFDLIFSSGNGLAPVDDAWFEHSEADVVLGVPVQLVPAEELIWHKAFVMERERFDGADIAHLLRARGGRLDWERLLGRFAGPHGRVLLAHLVLFGYIYPDERSCIPDEALLTLIGRLAGDAEGASTAPCRRLCRGPLLSRAQYLPDLGWWGYADARLEPLGALTSQQIAHWTAAIDHKA